MIRVFQEVLGVSHLYPLMPYDNHRKICPEDSSLSCRNRWRKRSNQVLQGSTGLWVSLSLLFGDAEEGIQEEESLCCLDASFREFLLHVSLLQEALRRLHGLLILSQLPEAVQPCIIQAVSLGTREEWHYRQGTQPWANENFAWGLERSRYIRKFFFQEKWTWYQSRIWLPLEVNYFQKGYTRSVDKLDN